MYKYNWLSCYNITCMYMISELTLSIGFPRVAVNKYPAFTFRTQIDYTEAGCSSLFSLRKSQHDNVIVKGSTVATHLFWR